MAGSGDDAQFATAYLNDVAVFQSHVYFHGVGLYASAETCHLRRYVIAERLVVDVGCDFHAVFIAHIVVAEAMVEMQVCVYYLRDFKIVGADIVVKFAFFGSVNHAGVNDCSVAGVLICDEISVDTEHIKNELFDL